MKGYAPILIIAIALIGGYLIQSRVTARVDYQCGECEHRFSLTPLMAMIAPHRMGSKWVRCPHCGARTWANPVPKA